MIVYSPWKSIFPLGAMKKCPFQSIETSVRFMNKAFPAISYAWLHLMSPCQENSICYRLPNAAPAISNFIWQILLTKHFSNTYLGTYLDR